MEIIFHAHHAVISPRLQQRAESSLRRLVARLGRAVDAVVRIEQDGPARRVELVLHAPRGRRLVARGEGRFFGPALTMALGKLTAQITRSRTAHGAATRRRPSRATGRRKRVAV